MSLNKETKPSFPAAGFFDSPSIRTRVPFAKFTNAEIIYDIRKDVGDLRKLTASQSPDPMIRLSTEG